MVAVGIINLKRLVGMGLIVLAVLAPWYVNAEEEYGLKWLVGSQLQHEDNLFLQPDGLQKTDSVVGTFAQGQYKKRYSLQKFELKGKIVDYRYSTADYLNYLAKDLDAKWSWALTPDFTGTLSSSRQQALNSFLDYNASERNLRNERKDALDMRWRITGGWHLAAGGARTAVRNARNGERFVEGDFSANNYEYGATYSFPSQSEITLVQISESGEYRARTLSEVNQTDSGFGQTNQELRFDWLFSVKSKLKIKIGHQDREHDHFAARNYQGTYGAAEYLWSNGGKFNLKFSARQDYTSFQSSPSGDLYYASIGAYYFNSSYYRRQMVSVTPTWQLADKIILSGSLQQENRDYLGGLVAQSLLAQRQDSLHQGSFTLTWVPRDIVALSVFGTMQDRRSNLPKADFDANSLGVSATLSF